MAVKVPTSVDGKQATSAHEQEQHLVCGRGREGQTQVISVKWEHEDEATRSDLQHAYLLRENLAAYMAEIPEQEADNTFLRHWARRATPTVTGGTNEIALTAKSPHLSLMARLHH